MAKGDTLFFSDNDWISHMIQLVTGGKFDHCAIALSDTTMMDANENGVMIEKSIPNNGVLVPTAAKCPQLEAAILWAFQQVGKPYDFHDFFEIGYYHLFPHQKPPVVREDDSEYVCSELVGYFLLKAGYPFSPPRDYNDMEWADPNLLYKWLQTD